MRRSHTALGRVRRGALLLALLLLALARPGLAWAAACLDAVCGDAGAACCCAADEVPEVPVPLTCCDGEGPSLGAPLEGSGAGDCACEWTPLPEAPPLDLVEGSRSHSHEDTLAAARLSSRTLAVHHGEAPELLEHDPPRWDPDRGVLARRGVIAFLAVLSVARI